MNSTPLLIDPNALALEDIITSDTQIVLSIRTTETTSLCPRCHQPSNRIHSHYQRTVADLPWQGVRVQLQLLSRRFFCDYPPCLQRIFCQRLPTVVAAYGRQTLRLNHAFGIIGLMLGGQAGAQLAVQLGMSVSADTLLRRLRQRQLSTYPTPRVLGVDDWAWRKGHDYGTLLVDLERHQPIELLADRTAATLADWLRQHPGIEIVTRDRSQVYAEGIRAGAPQAIQVADRWHLLKNLSEMMRRVIAAHTALVEKATAMAIQEESFEAAVQQLPISMLSSQDAKAVALRRQQRYARYQAVKTLHAQGLKRTDIARQVGLDVVTVRKFIRAEVFPERVQYRFGSRLDPYIPYLHKRWCQGEQSVQQLWSEIKEQGYPGNHKMVDRYLRQLRRHLQPLNREQRQQWLKAQATFPRPTIRQVSQWLLKRNEELNLQQQRFVEHLCHLSPTLQAVHRLGQTFQQIVQQQESARFDQWLVEAEQSMVVELKEFAARLRQDYGAVVAALEYPWSNGQVEGQVNKLKLIKRQMYGRAKLDLLKARMLQAS